MSGLGSCSSGFIKAWYGTGDGQNPARVLRKSTTRHPRAQCCMLWQLWHGIYLGLLSIC